MLAVEPLAPSVRSAAPVCLYCDSRDLEPFVSGVRDRLGHVPGERTFVRCRACGSAVLDPLPTTAELPGFYPPVYSFAVPAKGQRGLKSLFTRVEHALFFRPQYRAQVRAVMRACGWRGGEGRRLLDIGCGRGLRLLEFRARGFEVHGLDVIPDVVRYLAEELQIPAACGDVSEMGRHYKPESFDLITAFFLLEHVPDVHATLDSMATLLKPGGWLAAAVPLVDCPQVGLFGRRWIEVAEAPRHLSLPTRAGMVHAFRSAGLDRITVQPDSAMICAGQVGLSVVSRAAVTHAYGSGGLRPLAARLLGAGITLLAAPLCWVQNRASARTPLGIVIGQKAPRETAPCES